MKRYLKSGVAGIAVIMTAVLTACSSAGHGHDVPAGQEMAETKKEVPKDFVYQASFEKVKAELSWVQELSVDGDKVAMAGSVYEKAKGEKEERQHTYLLTCDLEKETDGTGSRVKEDSICRTEIPLDNNLSVGFLSIRETKDGEKRLYLLASDDQAGQETAGMKSNIGYYLYTFDLQGKLLDSYGLNTKERMDFYVGTKAAFVTEEGCFYAASNTGIFGFDLEGNQTSVRNFGGTVSSMACLSPEKAFVLGAGADGGSMWKLLDLQTGEFGEIHRMGEYQFYSADICPDGEDAVFLADASGAYHMELAKGEVCPLFSWLNVGVDGEGFLEVAADQGNMIAVTAKEENAKGVYMPELAFLEPRPASEQEILTLWCSDPGEELQEKLLEFNKSGGDCRIECVDYSSYEDAGLQMNLDMISGKTPDIICTRGLPVEQYVNKGLFLDLYSLMEDDPEIHKEDFVESVRLAAETDGKLYFMGSRFEVSALAGSKKLLGNRDSWTMEDLKKIYESMPEDSEIMRNQRRQWFLNDYLNAKMMDHIDWKTGKTRFDTKEFQEILELAKTFPDQKENVPEKNDRALAIRNGKVLLEVFPLYDFSLLPVFSELYQEVGGFTVLDYPSEENSGFSMKFSDSPFAITQQCEDREAAWQFIRQFFTFDYQKAMDMNDEGGFPTRKDALEKQFVYAQAKKKYVDSDGTRVTPLRGSNTVDGKEISMRPITEEEIELVRDVIDRIGSVNDYNGSSRAIGDIIREEAESYFAGDKTVEEVTEIIKSRVELYLSENS